MAPLEYHRPKSLAEALSLLPRGTPLGGGTALTPQRNSIESVIDLQSLGLDRHEAAAGEITAGAAESLEAFAVACAGDLAALSEAARLEAGLNIRNMATVAGALIAADGSSSLATTLLAARARLVVEPGSTEIPVDEALHGGAEPLKGKIVTALRIPRPAYLGYRQVARSPADRPIVCASVARSEHPSRIRGALGGYGNFPSLLEELPPDPEAAGIVAREVYAVAGDAWASAEYRAHVAGVLIRRLVAEALGR
jgi:carbon-monoxide dehydrogenase medium subunit